MTNNLTRLLRYLVIGGLLLTVLTISTYAHAQCTEPPCPPSIAFLDERDITVDYDRLREDERLAIQIRNNDPDNAQDVQLRLVGLVPLTGEADPALSQLLATGPATATLPPLEIRPFTLTFDIADATSPEAGSYEGYLVATGSLGDIIRRKLVLQVEAEEPEPKPMEQIPVVALPEQMKELTLAGINFLPSLLSAWSVALFWLGVVILILRWRHQILRWVERKLKPGLFAGQEAHPSPQPPPEEQTSASPKTTSERILFVLGVLFLVVGGVLSVVGWDDRIGLPELRLVDVGSVLVPAQSGTEHVGQVVAPDGSVGVLVRDVDRLVVRGIPHAEKYAGNIDLLPAKEEKGDVKVTVNVADWWPYAFLTIALGVFVGYRLTKYYEKERSVAEQRVYAAELWQEVVDHESRFQEKHAGCPYAGYSMVALAKEWIGDVEQKLDAGDIDDDSGAKDLLKKLKTYADLFVDFQGSIATLYDLRNGLRQQFEKRRFGLELKDVEALQRTNALVAGTPFSFDSEDVEGTVLKAKKEGVEEKEVPWLKELLDTLRDIDRWLRYAEGLKPSDGSSWHPEGVRRLREILSPGNPEAITRQEVVQKLKLDKSKLDPQIAALKSAGKKALLAIQKEEVVTQREEAVKAYDKILGLAEKAAREAAEEARASWTDAQPPAFGELMARKGVPYDGTDLLVGTDIRPAEEEGPTCSGVSCEVLTLDGQTGKPCRADFDDLFKFTADLQFPAPLPADYRVQWDFGDGATSPVIRIPKRTKGSKDVEVTHRFSTGGREYKVRLMALKDGASMPLGEHPVTVKPRPGRHERRLGTFRLSDFHMTVVSGLLAVGSGLWLLYFGGSPWGTPADYLKAFLWGSVVSEAAKQGATIVSNLATGKWPLTSS